MQWIKGIATTLIVTLLTMVLLTAFQRPIADYFAPDRLQAKVEIGPWYPLLASKADQQKIPAILGVSDFVAHDFMDEQYSMARVTVENNTSKPISEIRLRYKGGIDNPYIVESDGDKPTYDYLGQVKSVEMPDLKPGQSIKLYIWKLSGFGFPFYFRDFDTFSSEGPWRIDFRTPKSIGEEIGEDALERFLLAWGDDIMMFCLFGLIAVLLIACVAQWLYVRDLVSDAPYYEAERQRFESDPDKFKLRLKGLGDFFGRHALERRRAKPKSQEPPEQK